MLKKILLLTITIFLLAPGLYADPVSDQQYINQLNYRNNRLELVTKHRKIDIQRSYGYTDIDTYSYSFEAYSQSSTDISRQDMTRSEVKEVTDWYILKGRVRELSDAEFLRLVGDQQILDSVVSQENSKSGIRKIGNALIIAGTVVMVGGAATSAGEQTITGGAIGMVAGFFLTALNASPQHYIQPDYAQQKIDEYNIALKRKLGLPLDFN
ncbi:MAG: hypothetical protein U9R38_04875 [Candidatus Margulisiibacteriota bacterium]|nr:hypothetical protein [Candidatus Margulisiibacteriota bacterium]